MTDLLPPGRTSAITLADDIRSGRRTARSVVEAHIQHARRVNPALNAIVNERYDDALGEADHLDARIRAGEQPDGLLLGVPCTIKESFAVAGMPNTSGLRSRTGYVPDADAVTVARLRDHGAIVLGNTNISELCMWMESDNPVYGRTNNPYDVRCTPGGSSGGEGAIVGAGASVFGLGADVGGSIRMPAFFNGVFGHKPGSGVVPNSGQHPIAKNEAQRYLCTGPIARCASDLMPLLRILAGPDGVDPVCEPLSLGDPDTVSLEGMTVLDVPDNELLSVDPRLRHAQSLVARHLARQGARVRTARFPYLRKSFDIWSGMMGAAEGPRSFLELLERRRRRELLPHLFRRDQHSLPAVVLGLVEDVSHALPSMARRSVDDGALLRQRLLHAIGDGVMLFPSYPQPAPRHRTPLRQVVGWAYTAIFNVMGFPVTQVPLGLDARGLPLGVQVVGTPGNDHVTIRVALELERAFGGWVPPVNAPHGVA